MQRIENFQRVGAASESGRASGSGGCGCRGGGVEIEASCSTRQDCEGARHGSAQPLERSVVELGECRQQLGQLQREGAAQRDGVVLDAQRAQGRVQRQFAQGRQRGQLVGAHVEDAQRAVGRQPAQRPQLVVRHPQLAQLAAALQPLPVQPPQLVVVRHQHAQLGQVAQTQQRRQRVAGQVQLVQRGGQVRRHAHQAAMLQDQHAQTAAGAEVATAAEAAEAARDLRQVLLHLGRRPPRQVRVPTVLGHGKSAATTADPTAAITRISIRIRGRARTIVIHGF